MNRKFRNNNKVREKKYELFINFLDSESVVLKKSLFASLCDVESGSCVLLVLIFFNWEAT